MHLFPLELDDRTVFQDDEDKDHLGPEDKEAEELLENKLLTAEDALIPTNSRRSSHIVQIHQFIAKDTLEGSSASIAGPTISTINSATIKLKDFDLLSVIGKGAYGKVFLVRKKGQINISDPDQHNNIYAMKVLKKAHIVLRELDKTHTKNERSILEAVRHPFIVKLYYAFQTASKLYLILSFASGGELFTYLAQERMFSESVACFYSGELLLAIEHLHSLGIIYRDLKPENVLLNTCGHIMLTDFGLSKVAIDASTICGTLEFMAPEVIAEKMYDHTVDYWSLGIMIFDMLTGSPPFTGNNRKKVMEQIMNKKLVFPKYVTSFAKDLLQKLLKKSPSQRLGSGAKAALDIKNHSFYRKIDWVKLLNKEITPPLTPKINEEDAVCNFSKEFTGMSLADTPPNPGTNESHHGQHHFQGFSYAHDSTFL